MNFDEIERVAHALVVSKATKTDWSDLIAQAQLHSYEACKRLVEIAGSDETSRATVREIAFDLYEDKARLGDQEALAAFRGYAEMAQDADLIARFTIGFEPHGPDELGAAPTGDMAKTLAGLGIDPATMVLVGGGQIIPRFD